MANTAKWVGGASPAGSALSLHSTSLNSLGNNTASAASSAVANHTNLDLYGQLWLHLASLSPTAGGYLTIYILTAIDDSTYPSATGTVLRNQPDKILWTFPLDTTAATAQDLVTPPILLPMCDFKIVLDNQAGVALGASGNTLQMITGNFNLNA